jgi:hypothetical protein
MAGTPAGGDAAGAYFHITVTVPAELQEMPRANQRDDHGVLMQASAAAIIELAHDPRYFGGTVGVLAVQFVLVPRQNAGRYLGALLPRLQLG